jgi:hypothetical protein
VADNPISKLWNDFCNHMLAEGSVIKGAPVAFALSVVLTGLLLSVGAWKAAGWLYAERIAVLEATIQGLGHAPGSTVARHLKPEQKAKLTRLLRLGPTEKFNLQINSIPNCEECEDYAQELREFFGSLPGGWTAGGGVTIFPVTTSFREGTHITIDVDHGELGRRLLLALEDASVAVTPTESVKLAGDMQGLILVGKALK